MKGLAIILMRKLRSFSGGLDATDETWPFLSSAIAKVK